jgi:patatin-related protein
VALVLYGGVSLAVYENGVSRCFYDLVRRRGVFDIVLELLDASAVVDVVTGTSAGGINGLFLAAALESGTEFAPSADLWRRLADLGELFREPKRSADIESLFDGEYLHQELFKAFEELCQVANPTYESPGEMDVFITGTDLDGHRRRYLDSLGAEIDDKEHRVVFHLEHRPGRKSLGISEAKTGVNPKKQAAILGTLARITASFPLGFPPVQGSALDAAVQQALNETSKILPTDESMFVEGRSFVDGGVLDNKPFGPALRAIFYRMPAGVVDRRLFYVEPDPVPFAGVPKKEHSPIAVGIAALTAIPGHEGIAEDLEQLLTHNQRVRWLAHLKDTLLQRLGQNAGGAAPPSSTYLQTRIDCVARSLVLSSDAVPSAGDYPKDATRVILLEGIRCELRKRIENTLGNIDPHTCILKHILAFEAGGGKSGPPVIPGSPDAVLRPRAPRDALSTRLL